MFEVCGAGFSGQRTRAKAPRHIFSSLLWKLPELAVIRDRLVPFNADVECQRFVARGADFHAVYPRLEAQALDDAAVVVDESDVLASDGHRCVSRLHFEPQLAFEP